MKKLLFAAMMLLIGGSAFAQLPSVQLKDLDGNIVDTSTLSNDGNPFVISFFATWCKPCIRELKAINDYYPDWQEETGMKLIAVSIDEAQNVSRVKPLVEGQGFEYEVLLDTNSDFKRSLGIKDVPYLIIVDGNGNIAETRNGYTEGSEGHIIEKIRQLKAAQ